MGGGGGGGGGGAAGGGGGGGGRQGTAGKGWVGSWKLRKHIYCCTSCSCGYRVLGARERGCPPAADLIALPVLSSCSAPQDLYTFARCKVPLPVSLLAKTGVPQPAELVDVVEHDCEWEEFQVGKQRTSSVGGGRGRRGKYVVELMVEHNCEWEEFQVGEPTSHGGGFQGAQYVPRALACHKDPVPRD